MSNWPFLAAYRGQSKSIFTKLPNFSAIFSLFTDYSSLFDHRMLLVILHCSLFISINSAPSRWAPRKKSEAGIRRFPASWMSVRRR